MKVEELIAEIERLEAEIKAQFSVVETATAEVERLRAALEMICGRRPCPDNLLGNADIARLAIDNIARKALDE